MKKIVIGNGVEITDLALGACNPALDSTPKIMSRYLDMGGNIMDTARAYFDGEYDTFLGKWIRDNDARDRVNVCMKGCMPLSDDAMYISRLSKSDIKGDLEKSLMKAGIDHTDIYLLHRDDPKIPVSEIMPALDELVKEGKTRVIGVSNWTGARIEAANRFARENGLEPFRVCQMHFSLAQTTPAATGDITHVPMSDVEYRWHLDNDFPIMAFASQGKGFFGRYEKGTELKPFVYNYYGYFPENWRRAERACELAKKYATNASAVALAYLLQNKLRVSALMGFTSMEQFDLSMQAAELRLSEEDLFYLENGR
ncbi:MAG: aldo/keto reductase [Clostridia bacterium]|nr:aldo/keto reductase [Clostridia bacterium]